jgi:hemerythrin-like domain-containing protein
MADVTERDAVRVIAWSQELRRVHERLRGALQITRDAIQNGAPGEDATRDLLLYCHGFCVALDGHHGGEDRVLFPAIEAAYPHLAPVLRALQRDHSMIAHLLNGLQSATEHVATPEDLAGHLEGVAAIMESHFRYEERQLLTVLESLNLQTTTEEALGPI